MGRKLPAKKICITLALTLLALTWVAPCLASGTSRPVQVLLLNSYHHNYKWSDDILDGIESVFVRQRPDAELHVEYMDTKRHSDPSYLEELATLYRSKYEKTAFDLIISNDNHAFNFLRARPELFPDVPVVFCGVNFFQLSDLEGSARFTGVNEDTDFAATLDLALLLHPETRKVVVVNDTTVTGKRLRPRLMKVLKEISVEVNVEFLDDVTMEELTRRLGQLGPDSIVLYTLFFRDKAGEFFEYDDSVSRVVAATARPVYGVWDFSLGYGIVGGMLTSGYYQGETAAKLGMRILDGESPGDIPVVMRSPNRLMFDHAALRRFNIPESGLPPGSIILNRPSTLYEMHPEAVWAAGTAIVVLIFTVFFLVLLGRHREQAQQAIRESERKYRELAEMLPQIVVELDRSGIVTYTNRHGPELLGYTEEEVRSGVHISRLFDPNDLAKMQGNMERRLRGETGGANEYRMLRKDGTTFPVLSYSAPVFKDGQVVAVRAIVVDISKLKRLEQQLLQSQKMEAVGTLASGIAHDFNNLLQAISGYTQLLMEVHGKQEPTREYLERIDEASVSAANLVNRILTFSRRSVPELTRVDLNEEVHRVIGMLERTIPRMIRIEPRLADDINAVWADAGQVEQLIMNLAANARDAMPDGGVLSIETKSITLSAKECTGYPDVTPGEFIQLRVADTGAGMNAEIARRIFEPFFTTKGVGRGTGLGLSTVYGIVGGHHGIVTCSSEPGCGTAFTIQLPVARSEEGGDEPSAAAPPTRESSGTECILLVDDEPAVREIAGTGLSNFGYSVMVAESGEAALDLYRQKSGEIDLVVLDLGMPGMGGRRCLKALLAVDPDVKVIVASGYSVAEHAEEVKKEGARMFVGKPYRFKELAGIIRKVLEE